MEPVGSKKTKAAVEEIRGPEFDLSHIPLKENHAELPLWVGDLRKKYYFNSKGARTENFEMVASAHPGDQPLPRVLLAQVQGSLRLRHLHRRAQKPPGLHPLLRDQPFQPQRRSHPRLLDPRHRRRTQQVQQDDLHHPRSRQTHPLGRQLFRQGQTGAQRKPLLHRERRQERHRVLQEHAEPLRLLAQRAGRQGRRRGQRRRARHKRRDLDHRHHRAELAGEAAEHKRERKILREVRTADPRERRPGPDRREARDLPTGDRPHEDRQGKDRADEHEHGGEVQVHAHPRVRLQARDRAEPHPRLPSEDRGEDPAVPGEGSQPHVRRRPCALRHHRAAVRRGQDAGGHHRDVPREASHAHPVYQQHHRQAVGKADPRLQHALAKQDPQVHLGHQPGKNRPRPLRKLRRHLHLHHDLPH